MQSIVQLVYVSEATAGLTNHEVLQILERSQSHNHALKISGLLLFDGTRFMQLLEGDEQSVTALYNQIALDTRHRDVQLIGRFTAEKPAMPTWAMAYFSELNDSPLASQHHFVMNKSHVHQICDCLPEQVGALFWEAVNGVYPMSIEHPAH